MLLLLGVALAALGALGFVLLVTLGLLPEGAHSWLLDHWPALRRQAGGLVILMPAVIFFALGLLAAGLGLVVTLAGRLLAVK